MPILHGKASYRGGAEIDRWVVLHNRAATTLSWPKASRRWD